jgi:hypothetical protein
MITKTKEEIIKESTIKADELLGEIRYLTTRIDYDKSVRKANYRYANKLFIATRSYRELLKLVHYLDMDYYDFEGNFCEDVYLVHYEYLLAPVRSTNRIKIELDEALNSSFDEENMPEYWNKKAELAHAELLKRDALKHKFSYFKEKAKSEYES